MTIRKLRKARDVDLIADALSLEVPVIVGTNGLSEPAFLKFTDGYAMRLHPNAETLLQWIEDTLLEGQEKRPANVSVIA